MIKFKIKSMANEHLDEVALLEKSCFSVPWTKSLLKNEIDNNNSKFLVAVDENQQVMGYIGFNYVLDEGYITNLAVFPEYRGNGVAQELLKNVIDFAYQKKLKFVSLEVRITNVAAISLYEKFNFLKVGERKGFYTCPKENALIMTRDL